MSLFKNFFITIKNRGLIVAIIAALNVIRVSIESSFLHRTYVIRNIHSYKMYLDTKDMGLCRSLLLFGTREVDHKILLEKIAKPAMTVLDIGANIGYYALMELNLIGAKGKLIAVEPSPKNIEIFKNNLDLNGISNVKVIEGAISDKEEKKDFHLADMGNLNTFHATGTGLQHLTGEVIKVNAYTIPQIMKDEGPLDLIRMDVEGHEVEVLNGMLSSVSSGELRPSIIFETHLSRYGKEHDMESVLKLYFSEGYKTRYLASSYEGGTAIIEARGYKGSLPIATDGVQRKIFENISDNDSIDFICNVGGARTVVLEPSPVTL